MNIDHIGVVVKSIVKGIMHWQEVFGYKQYTGIVVNSCQKAKVIFLEKVSSIPIKLLQPVGMDSPIYQFAKKCGGLHHLCFKCGDVAIETNIMKKKGFRILAPPKPGEAFENRDIAFVNAKHGLNIELIDTDKRAKVL